MGTGRMAITVQRVRSNSPPLITCRLGRPPILQQEYHTLYQLLGDDGSPPPFAILLRSFTELREHGVNIHEAPTNSLKRILTLQNQYVPLGRWIELWSAMVRWVEGDTNTGSTTDHIREMNDIVLQRMVEHKEITQDDSTVSLRLWLEYSSIDKIGSLGNTSPFIGTASATP